MTTTSGPTLPVARAGHQAYALPGNGSVILVGGTDGRNPIGNTGVYQPWAGQFIQQASLNTPRNCLSSTLLRRGGQVAAGGSNGNGFVAGAESYSFATAETDKADYQPGNVATFTGSGWKPGETVTFTVTAYPVDAHHTEFSGTAVADSTGQIHLSTFTIDKSHIGMKFLLKATGSQSQAEVTFTDAADPTSVTGTTNPSTASPYGQNVFILGNINDLPPSANGPRPQGTIFITDNNITIGTTVPAGNANFTGSYSLNVLVNDITGVLSPGEHNFQVQFVTGDGTRWGSSLSSLIPFTVTAMDTSIAFAFHSTRP